MAKITYQMLADRKACQDSLLFFRELFGEETEVNDAAIHKFVSFSDGYYGYLAWLYEKLLNERGKDEFRRRIVGIPHAMDGDGRCQGCLSELYAFADLYNREEYRVTR